MKKEEEEEEEFKVMLRCSDGVSIDAKPFAKESKTIGCAYEYRHFNELDFEGQRNIVYKVREYCEERAKIKDDPVNDDILVLQKLNAFNSQFLQLYQTDAIHLIIAAFNLGMKSLRDLMMEDVVDMLTQMTADEIYDIFHVNLKKYNYYKFECMVCCLDHYQGAFE